MSSISLLGEKVFDTISLISFLGKQRSPILYEAQNLAQRAKDQPDLETLMAQRAKSMVNQLKSGKIKWSEFQKAVVVQTLLGAMAGVALADSSDETMTIMWNQSVGHMTQYLPGFLSDIKEAMDRGDLKEEESEDYAERRGIASWGGLVTRLIRYVANPSYSFFKMGEFHAKRRVGMTQMRRVAVGDDRTCPDCIWWDELGWQNIGEIPLPGNSCRCMDRCRCHVDYR